MIYNLAPTRAPTHTIYTHDVSRSQQPAAREEARQVQQSAAWGWAQHVSLPQFIPINQIINDRTALF